MKRLARVCVVALLIGTLFPGCGEPFAIGSGVGLAIGAAGGRAGEGLLAGAACGVLAEGLWVTADILYVITDFWGSDPSYHKTFFFSPKPPKHESEYGVMIAGGVFGVAGVLLAAQGEAEMAITSGLLGGGFFVMGLLELRGDSERGKTTFLVGPTGVGVAHSF